jgi:phage-related holin
MTEIILDNITPADNTLEFTPKAKSVKKKVTAKVVKKIATKKTVAKKPVKKVVTKKAVAKATIAKKAVSKKTIIKEAPRKCVWVLDKSHAALKKTAAKLGLRLNQVIDQSIADFTAKHVAKKAKK